MIRDNKDIIDFIVKPFAIDKSFREELMVLNYFLHYFEKLRIFYLLKKFPYLLPYMKL